ncbi:MAG: aminotransferase class I/II-fold pyridoxal phosphate-dependent enzyme [Bacteroidetes bacterium]|nr:aminotransferase class I/II-fold pyridoxal phosphate-dependent enzyme [Bacteroidota bacterium]
MNIPRKHSGSDLTIFSEMSALAQQHNAINLSQGFPDYEIDGRLKKLLAKACDTNHNQYAPLQGNPLLIDNLASFNQNRTLPLSISKEEITIVPGATYAIYTALATILQPGDEVIVFDPCYDSYVPAIEMNGGKPIFVPLNEKFELNWLDLENAISDKTKAIIINSPNNPSGKIWSATAIDKFWNYIKDREIFIISDEVYDLLVYDDAVFYSALHHPEIRKRCFSIFSFGKMFHITGWKMGYIIACEALSTAFRRIHQYLTFCANAPAQQALAEYIEIFDPKENQKTMQSKRDFFLQLMQDSPFEIKSPAQGSYFQTMNFKNYQPNMSDKDFSVWLTIERKVATIPVSAFYHDQRNTGNIRFCFAKKEETLEQAAKNLRF